MNLLLWVFIFGVSQVTGLLRNSITGCARVVFLIDTSDSIHLANYRNASGDQYYNRGYLPEIKAGINAFIDNFNATGCACLEVAINSFASQAYYYTNGTFVSPAAAKQALYFVDYPHSPFCDFLQNYIANFTDFQQNSSGFYNETIQQCLNNQSFFIEQALLYNNVCGRAFCDSQQGPSGYCGPYPVCGFTNFEAALYSAANTGTPNYAILITDGDPTIVNGTYPDCQGSIGQPDCPGSPACIASYCPSAGDCSDPVDLARAVAAADYLKALNAQGTKVITVTRSPPASQRGIENLLQIASCPIDGQTQCVNVTKIGTTAFIVSNYSEDLSDVLTRIPRLVICNTNSPTTFSPSSFPTSSPTFKISQAPSPPTCCNCSQGPTTRFITTSSPTPAFCTDTSCPNGCICLGTNVTGGAVTAGVVPDGLCARLTCVQTCYNPNEDFTPTPVTPTGAPTTRQPTPRRNILLWLLPFLLGLSGGGGGGGGGGVILAPPSTTIVDIYHIIHGRRLLATCTNASQCPDKNLYRCENRQCIKLLPCVSDDNCTSTTYCNATFKVCRARAFLNEPCDVNPCVAPLFCFAAPGRPDLPPRCASASCVNCCQCTPLGEGVTCSPTPALAPGVVYRTLSPTTRRPTPARVPFNPWLLLFLFPGGRGCGGGGGRFPIGPIYRPGGTVVVDIYHIIHARQASFVNGSRDCTRIRSGLVYTTGLTMNLGSCTANVVIRKAQDCCDLCKSTITCVAWEYNSVACPGNATLSCRLISAATNGSTPFNVESTNVGPTNAVIGFMAARPVGIQFCNTTADCFNPGDSETDEGNGRTFCTDLGGLAPRACRTICSADNACVEDQGLDYCYKTGGQDGQFGFCIDGGERCLCSVDERVCNSTTTNPSCCPAPIVCCAGTDPRDPL